MEWNLRNFTSKPYCKGRAIRRALFVVSTGFSGPHSITNGDALFIGLEGASSNGEGHKERAMRIGPLRGKMREWQG